MRLKGMYLFIGEDCFLIVFWSEFFEVLMRVLLMNE